MTIDPVLLNLAADWCINLSAGWFGAAAIIPAVTPKPNALSVPVIIENIAFALAFFGISYILKTI